MMKTLWNAVEFAPDWSVLNLIDLIKKTLFIKKSIRIPITEEEYKKRQDDFASLVGDKYSPYPDYL